MAGRLENVLRLRNLTPHETVHIFRSVFQACSSGILDVRADPTCPVRVVHNIQTCWVRSLLRRYSPLVGAPVDDVVFQVMRTTPFVQQFVCDEVYASGRILFWEAVRRDLLEAMIEENPRMRSATRLVCMIVNAAEEALYAAEEPGVSRLNKVMSTDALMLFDADLEGLRGARAPFADEVAQLPWLARELSDIMAPPIWLEEQEPYEEFIQRSAAREARMLDAARRLWPEPPEPNEVTAPSGGSEEATTSAGDDQRMSARMRDLEAQRTLRPFGALPLDAEGAPHEADRGAGGM